MFFRLLNIIWHYWCRHFSPGPATREYLPLSSTNSYPLPRCNEGWPHGSGIPRKIKSYLSIYLLINLILQQGSRLSASHSPGPSREGRFYLEKESFYLFQSLKKKPHRHLIPYPQDNNMIPRSISSKELWRVNPTQTIELLRPSLITRKNSEKLFIQNLVYTTNCAKQYKQCHTVEKSIESDPKIFKV